MLLLLLCTRFVCTHTALSATLTNNTGTAQVKKLYHSLGFFMFQTSPAFLPYTHTRAHNVN